MAPEDAEPPAPTGAEPPDAADLVSRMRRRVVRRALVVLALLFAAALLVIWFQRFRIADNLIASELASRGIEARYRIEQIGPTREVLADIVIGDPAAPNLTIERLVVHIRPRFGIPTITAIELDNPRLVGSYRDGTLSFGALDPLLFTGSDQPFQLPDMALALRDAQVRLDTDYGRVSAVISGNGQLRSGFSGALAMVAPSLDAGGCALDAARLSGTLSIEAERPRFAGPLRFASLACAASGLALGEGRANLALRLYPTLDGLDGKARLALGPLGMPGIRAASLGGTTDFTWRDEALTARYDLTAADLATGQAGADALTASGLLRARDNFARIETDGELTGRAIRPGPAFDKALASAQSAGEGTLAAPLIARVRRQLAAELRGSQLAAEFTARIDGDQQRLVVPRATLSGTSGAALVTLTRAAAGLAQAGGGLERIEGKFATGGAGLPRFTGGFERDGAAQTRFALAMASYQVGEAVLALPRLSATLTPGGTLALAGRLVASGPLPGGRAADLVLPISGSYAPARGLALWNDCTKIGFERLELSNLALLRDNLTLCPPSGGAIVRYDERAGLRIAAGAPSLRLVGNLGTTPVRLTTGPVGLAWPGTLTAREINVALGPTETASRFAITNLTADLSRDLGGTFDGADIKLAAVPLDLTGAAGTWRYTDGRLALTDGSFTLKDRAQPDRFRPLAADGATLALQDNRITATAPLREPRSQALVARADIAHDLATGTGHADLTIPGITFGPQLQPTDLSPLALGVVALVDGKVTGSGRIDWSPQTLTSSGSFSSADLDFAAAFGPVEGAAGTVTFTDLLGLTTAPAQRLTLAAVNPGIEIYDGAVEFQLRGGQFIDLQSAAWPFLGGTLAMRPLTIAIGVPEERGYVLDITGLEAAKFVQRMELDNLSATGTLDGTIPLIFDADGNGRLEDGLLVTRHPGGNVAYVGQLTYEDMTPMVNFAFDTLRSVDYRQMRIGMDGPLTGELVTRVALEGLSQGADLDKNIITRQLAKIPIRLLVNVRAPFYQLISSVRSLYDPSAVRDPRELGLIGDTGEVLQTQTDQTAVEARDEAASAAAAQAQEAERQGLVPPEPAGSPAGSMPEPIDPATSRIQPSESEPVP